MTTDIRSALEEAGSILAILEATETTYTSCEDRSLRAACDQFHNVLTQLTETTKRLEYRIEHIEEKTGFRDMRNILNREDPS